MRAAPLLFLSLVFIAPAAFGVDFDVSPKGDSQTLCRNVRGNAAALYAARAVGAKQTYRDMKKNIQQTLAGGGEKEAELLSLYDELIKRLEAGDFSPPKTAGRAAGELEFKKYAAVRCLARFQTPEEKASRE